jgi:acyl-ACP thioesterase
VSDGGSGTPAPMAMVPAATGRALAGEASSTDVHACSVPIRVRFDEAGPDGRLRTSTLLRYAQDLAWHHSAERGFTRAWYAERGLVWLARAAEVAVLAPILVGDELVGTTRVVGWRRVWARRRTDFLDADGVLVGWTHVDWVLIDGRGVPTRIPSEFDGAFGSPAATFPLGRVDIGQAPPDAGIASFAVRPQELDPMDHANNAVYADWLEESVIMSGRDDGIAMTRVLPRLVRLEYARAAERGATIVVQSWPDDDGWTCRITDAAGEDLLRARLGPIRDALEG